MNGSHAMHAKTYRADAHLARFGLVALSFAKIAASSSYTPQVHDTLIKIIIIDE